MHLMVASASLPWPTVGSVGVWFGLAGFVVYSIIRGLLIPKNLHEEIVKDRDTWRAAAQAEAEARKAADKRADDLLEVANTNIALVGSLQRVSRERQQGQTGGEEE